MEDGEDDHPRDKKKATPPSSRGKGKFLVDVTGNGNATLERTEGISDMYPNLNQSGRSVGFEFVDGLADGKIVEPAGVAVPSASGSGTIDMTTGASGSGCSVVGTRGGWKEIAGFWGLLVLAWIGLALLRRKPKTGK